MKPSSLPDFWARTPQCHSLCQPGGFSALWHSKTWLKRIAITTYDKMMITIRENRLNSRNETCCRHLRRSFHWAADKALEAVKYDQIHCYMEMSEKLRISAHCLRVVQCQSIPDEARRQRIWLWTDLRKGFVLFNGLIDSNILICKDST